MVKKIKINVKWLKRTLDKFYLRKFTAKMKIKSKSLREHFSTVIPCPSTPHFFAAQSVCLSFVFAVLSFGRCSNGFWHAINIACVRFPWLQPIFNLLMELNLAYLLQHFWRTFCVMWTVYIFFLHVNDLPFKYTHTKH